MSVTDILKQGVASRENEEYVPPQSHEELYQSALETIFAGFTAGRQAVAEGTTTEEINAQAKEVWEGHKKGLAADNLQEIKKIEGGAYDNIINLAKKHLPADHFATIKKMYHNLLKGDCTLKAMYLKNHHREDLMPALFALSKALGASSEKLASTHASPGVKKVLDAVCNNVDWIDLAINADKKVQGSTMFKKAAQYKAVFDFTKNFIAAPALNVNTITGILSIYKIASELISTDIVRTVMDDLRKGYNQEKPQGIKEAFSNIKDAVLADNDKYSTRVKELLAPTFADWTKAKTDQEKEKLLDKFAQVLPVASISEVRKQLNKAREIQQDIDKSTKELDRQFIEEFLPSLKHTNNHSARCDKDPEIKAKYAAVGMVLGKLKSELKTLNKGYEILRENTGSKKKRPPDVEKSEIAKKQLVLLGIQNCQKDITMVNQVLNKIRNERSLSKAEVAVISDFYKQVSYDQKDFWREDKNVASLISKQDQCLTEISKTKRDTYQTVIVTAKNIASSFTTFVGSMIPRGKQAEKTSKGQLI